MDKNEIKLICNNRRAKYDYEIIDSIEVGIVLVGHEVKSLVNKHVSLDAAYACVFNGELWLEDCNIDPYKFATFQQIQSKRKRKLLAHKKQIQKLDEWSQQKGFTLIPMKMYFKNGKVKVDLAICRGKQIHDKRNSIKEREAKQEMKR